MAASLPLASLLVAGDTEGRCIPGPALFRAGCPKPSSHLPEGSHMEVWARACVDAEHRNAVEKYVGRVPHVRAPSPGQGKSTQWVVGSLRLLS